jgi:GGDEF domain-containing protein
MHRYFFADQHFLGHVGGDDFFIGVTGSTVDDLGKLVDRLLADFHDGVFALYSEDDRAAGRMKGHDRRGADTFFPLMRCSIGVLELPKGLVIDDISRVGTAIAAIKTKAKESKSGVVFHPIGNAS